MKEPRTADSPITADSEQAQVVAYFPADRLLRGFVEAFIIAAGTHLPTKRLPGQTTFRSAHVHATIDTIAHQIADLKDVANDAHNRARRAMELALTAASAAEAVDWQEVSREARQTAADAEDEIAVLQARGAEVLPTGPFDAYTDILVPAMRRIATCGNRVSQAEYTSLRSLLPDLKMDQREGQWWASTSVRINTNEGVAELGPIEWCLGTGGHGTQALRARLTTPPEAGLGSRNVLKERLQLKAGLTHAATTTLLNTPFLQLPYVVLHHLLGDDFPSWVGEEWRDPRFGAWVAQVYADENFRWLGNGKYAQVAHLRQAVLTTLSADGPQSVGSLMEKLSVSRVHLMAYLTREHTEKGQKIRPWRPIVQAKTRSREGVTRSAILSCFTCSSCDKPFDISVRVPEVPSDLLCSCGAVPEPERYGMDPEIRFPAEYAALRLPLQECVAELRRRHAERAQKLNKKMRQIMCLTELLEPGSSALELAELGFGARDGFLSIPLRDLQELGLLQSDRSRPALWTYTDAGRQKAHELLAEENRKAGHA